MNLKQVLFFVKEVEKKGYTANFAIDGFSNPDQDADYYVTLFKVANTPAFFWQQDLAFTMQLKKEFPELTFMLKFDCSDNENGRFVIHIR